MNELKLFESPQFGQVRTVTIEDKPYFVASDVAKALGYAIPHKAVNTHCKGVLKRNILTNGGEQEVLVIPEGDIYRLVIKSQLPTAEKFESWVFDEVLPTIRTTGGYVNNDEMFINAYLPYADEQTKLMFKSQLGVIKSLNTRIEQDKPKVLFADAVSTAKTSILIGELAKLLKQNGVDTGQNRLFEWLRGNGYLIRRKGTDYNMPTQKSMEMKLFEVKETSINHSDGHIGISKTVKVTGKGQLYFINLFLEAKAS
jgi:anti-repressor protein